MSMTSVSQLLAMTPQSVLKVFGASPLHVDGDLLALAFAADGTLCTVEDPGTLRCWNIDARQQLRWFDLDDPSELWCFGPNAEVLAAASNEVALWDVATGEQRAIWPALTWVTALAFPPSGNLLATGHDDATVRLWDVAHRRLLREFHGHALPISALAFSHDGKRLASAGEDKLIRIWDVTTGKLLLSLIGHTDRVPGLAWHPDGVRLVSAGWDTTARVWDTLTGKPLLLLNSHAERVHALIFNRQGTLLACADAAHKVHIWNFAEGKTLTVLPPQGGEIRSLAFAGDGQRLASGGAERIVHVWQNNDADPELAVADPMASRTAVAYVGGGVTVAALAAGKTLRMWDVSTTGETTKLAAGKLRYFAVSSDGRYLAASRDEGDGPDDWNAKVLAYRDAPRRSLAIWNAVTGEPIAVCDGQRAPVTAIAFAPQGWFLASGSFYSSDVWLWHVPSGEPALLLPGVAEACSVEYLRFAPHGNLLAIASVDWMAAGASDGQVLLWDMTEREVARVLPGGGTGLAWHPAARRLAVASLAKSVRVFDVVTGEQLHDLQAHTQAVTCVAWSPGGRWIASGGEDRTVRLWDATSGIEAGVAELDTQVKAITFSPDGRALLTGNANTSCYLLDMAQLLES